MIKLTEHTFHPQIATKIQEVLDSGYLVQGEKVALFERKIGEYLQSENTVAVSSGTAALHLALIHAHIRKGDAVIVPAFTFMATANVVELVGARPILVDVEVDSYNMNATTLEIVLREWSYKEVPKAIMVVHQFGAPCEMDRIIEVAHKYGLIVIEDAACALGTTYQEAFVGTLGEYGCFSFHPRKNITTGEGGLIVTKEKISKEELQLLRNHGMKREGSSIDLPLPSYNYRLTEIAAVIGIVQFEEYANTLLLRKKMVNIYRRELKNIPSITLPRWIEGHSWQSFMVVLESNKQREGLKEHLRNHDVEASVGGQAIHLLSYYREKYEFKVSDFIHAKSLYENGLVLPLHCKLKEDDIVFICRKIKEFLRC